MARGKTQSHRSAPIVEDEGNIMYIQVQQEGLEVGAMLLQTVNFAILRNGRLAHAHVIGNDAAIVLRKRRDKVAIQVAPRRIAMYHYHWLPASFIHIVHVEAM